MRDTTKKLPLKIGGADLDFRITKLDAFSGARLLKVLSRAETDDLRALMLSLPDYELEDWMKTCLRHAEALLPAGPVRVYGPDGWGLPDLEHDGWTCLKLTLEVLAWTLEGFFPESGPPS